MTKSHLIFKLLTFCFLLTNTTSICFATDFTTCTPIDLRPKLNPIRNQGFKGWCYAYTAADLISYKLMPEGIPISANHLALQYNLNFYDSYNRATGSIKNALEVGTTSGVCTSDTRDFNSYMLLFTLKRYFDNKNQKQFDELLHLLSRPFSILSQVDLQTVYHFLRSYSAKNFAPMVLNHICQSHIHMFDNSIEIHDSFVGGYNSQAKHEFTQEELLTELHHQLKEENLAGISYYSDFLKAGTKSNSKTSLHGSTIAGRRWNKDHCEVLIRNSWGKSCIDESKTNKPKYNEHLTCEDGYIWVPDSILMQNLVGLTYL